MIHIPRFGVLPALLAALFMPHYGQAQANLASGVITSEPVTVAGNDFCQYFMAAWRELEGSEQYTLAIRERPSARRGSEITIDYAHKRIYRSALPASRAAIRGIGIEAALTAYQAVQQADLERRLVHDADLGPDDF